MKLINLLVCLIAPLTLVAEGTSSILKSQGYECTIKGMYYLSDEGVIAQYSDHPKVRESAKFFIDRGTGRAVGAIKNHNTTTYGVFEPEVVDKGNQEQYFKAVTIYGSHNPSIQVVRVQEFNDKAKKPFIESHGGSVTTGTCVNI